MREDIDLRLADLVVGKDALAIIGLAVDIEIKEMQDLVVGFALHLGPSMSKILQMIAC
jgi:hypothetical protein